MPIKDPLESTSLLGSPLDTSSSQDGIFVTSWRVILIIVLVAGNALTFMELTLLSVAVNPEFADTPLAAPKESLIFFFGCAMISAIPGGIAAERYGGKLVLLYAILIWSIATAVLPPFVGKHHKWLFITFSGIQGCCQGVILPSTMNLISAWFPDPELSSAISTTLCGLDIGLWIAVGVSQTYEKQWAYDVHLVVVAIVGILWCIAHALLTSATPEWHPRISLPEVQHITKGRPKPIALSDASNDTPMPFKLLFTHPALLAIYCTNGLSWSVFFVGLVCAPKYFLVKFDFDIASLPPFVYLPGVIGVVCSFIGGAITDRIIARGKISKRVIRIRMTNIALFGSSVGILLLNVVTSVGGAFFVISLTTACASTGSKSGWFSNIIDVAPNHAGVVTAITTAASMIPGAIATTWIAGSLDDSGVVSFLIGWGGSSIAAVLLCLSSLTYSMFCSADNVISVVQY